MIEEYSRQALDTLESIRMDSHAKQQLSALATAAINRKF
jgi:geranylgeranyl pyrophosphate synthase